MLRRTFTGLVLGFGLCLCVVHADEIGQGAPRAILVGPPASPDAFGGDLQQTVIPVTEFMPEVSGYSYQSSYGNTLKPNVPGIQRWHAPLGLPSGAAIEEIRVLVRDDDAVQDITTWLGLVARATDGSADCDGIFLVNSLNGTSAGINGYGTIALQAAVPWIVRSQETNLIPCGSPDAYIWYSLMVQLTSESQSLSGVVVRWRRAVSPAPAVATFNDVPTSHPFFQFVEALAASGITAGCGGGNFCPDNTLTRGQMAVFLAKALGLHYPL